MKNKIAIFSVPRSGSTWLGQIFNSNKNVIYKYQPLFSYAYKSFLDENSDLDDINTFYNKISQSNDFFINQTNEINEKIVPLFNKSPNKTHIIFKEVRYLNIIENLLKKDIRIIGLVRNPLAVINSWLSAPKEFRGDLNWDKLEEWQFSAKKNLNKKEEFNGFEKWKEATLLFEKYEKEYPNLFKIVEYKNLLLNSRETVEELFNFCSLEIQNQTLYFLNNDKESDNPYSVYKTKISDSKWKTNLNPLIIGAIKRDLKGSILEKYML